ncbi:hypothetical protein DRA43_04190 [Micromonospora provocatoris]|nr:hypothetical protein [Micromonospora provocatoris]RBJ09749.1 hypothetical protein DRA43_04190 [Micromonospora provocatoris]
MFTHALIRVAAAPAACGLLLDARPRFRRPALAAGTPPASDPTPVPDPPRRAPGRATSPRWRYPWFDHATSPR